MGMCRQARAPETAGSIPLQVTVLPCSGRCLVAVLSVSSAAGCALSSASVQLLCSEGQLQIQPGKGEAEGSWHIPTMCQEAATEP